MTPKAVPSRAVFSRAVPPTATAAVATAAGARAASATATGAVPVRAIPLKATNPDHPGNAPGDPPGDGRTAAKSGNAGDSPTAGEPRRTDAGHQAGEGPVAGERGGSWGDGRGNAGRRVDGSWGEGQSAGGFAGGRRADGQAHTILVIDDSTTVTAALSRLLSNAGYEPHVCHTGDDTMAYVRSTTKPSAVVVDVHLPDISGLVLSNKLREWLGPWTPIIVMSGDTSMETLRSLPHVGATYFLAKPVNANYLVECLREWVV